MKVTNTTEAPQGVHTLGGVAYVMPGESKELDLNVDQAKRASKLGFLLIEGTPSKAEAKSSVLQPVDVPENEIDQLRQLIENQKTETDRLNAMVADRDAQIADLTKAAGDDTLATEVTRLTGVVTDRETEITGLRAEIEKLTASLASAGQQQSNDQSQQAVTPVGPFEVKDTAPGWLGIFGADGVQIGKNIRSTDADAFRAMTPEQQFGYLTAPAAPASV